LYWVKILKTKECKLIVDDSHYLPFPFPVLLLLQVRLKRTLLIIYSAFSCFFVFAAEQSGENYTVYVIRGVDFAVDGITRPFVLMIHGDFMEGRRLSGRENLREYLDHKRLLLLNQRVLAEVQIEYVLGEREADGAMPVEIMVSVRDSWNWIVFPFPLYTTNDGFSLNLGVLHYNFLGTASILVFDFSYNQRGEGQGVDFFLQSSTPFQAAGLDWMLTFNHFFDYTFGQPLFYQNVTGLSVQFPLHRTTLTLGFNQYVTVNERPGTKAKIIYGVTGLYSPYGTTDLFASHRIPLGVNMGGFGEITYTLRLGSRINYPLGAMDEVRKPRVSFGHSAGFGRIDWIGNFRRGLSVSLSNSFYRYIGRSDAPFRVSLGGNVAFHWPLTGFAGISSRLGYQQRWQWSNVMNSGTGGWIPDFHAGYVLRGVLDSDIQADRMLSFNLDLPIRVLNFEPSRWFDNQRLRLFDFQIHLSPFIDLALLQGPYNRLKSNPYTGSRFNVNDMIRAGGFEIIFFSGFLRALQIRASFGYNLQNIRGFFQWDEVYISTFFHF